MIKLFNVISQVEKFGVKEDGGTDVAAKFPFEKLKIYLVVYSIVKF